MLNFNDMFMIKNIGNFNICAAVVVFIAALLIGVWHFKFGEDKSMTLLSLIALAIVSVALITIRNEYRDVYVALADQGVKIEHVLDEGKPSVENINGKYYFRCAVNPMVYTTSDELYKSMEEEYKAYIGKNELVKSEKEYQKNLQKWDSKGEDTNATKKR